MCPTSPEPPPPPPILPATVFTELCSYLRESGSTLSPSEALIKAVQLWIAKGRADAIPAQSYHAGRVDEDRGQGHERRAEHRAHAGGARERSGAEHTRTPPAKIPSRVGHDGGRRLNNRPVLRVRRGARLDADQLGGLVGGEGVVEQGTDQRVVDNVGVGRGAVDAHVHRGQ